MLFKNSRTGPPIRGPAPSWTAFLAAGILTTTGCSGDASRIDNGPPISTREVMAWQSLDKFPTEAGQTPLSGLVVSAVDRWTSTDVRTASPGHNIAIPSRVAHARAYYGALLRLPNEALFWRVEPTPATPVQRHD